VDRGGPLRLSSWNAAPGTEIGRPNDTATDRQLWAASDGVARLDHRVFRWKADSDLVGVPRH
jgi:hypothetical protein